MSPLSGIIMTGIVLGKDEASDMLVTKPVQSAGVQMLYGLTSSFKKEGLQNPHESIEGTEAQN